MKQFLILIILLTLVIQSSIGQSFNLSFSELENVHKRSSSIFHMLSFNEKIYSIRMTEDEKIELTIRNTKDLKTICKRIIIGGRQTTDQSLSDNFKLTDFVRLGKHIYIITQSYEKNSQNQVLIAQEIGDNGNFIGALKQIEAVKLNRTAESASINTFSSTDTTKLLIVSIAPFNDNQKQQVVFKTIDENLRNLSKIGIEMQQENAFNPEQVIMIKDGTILLLGNYDLKKRDINTDCSDKKTVAYLIRKDGTYKEFDISVPKLELNQMQILVSNDDKLLYVNGLYRDIANSPKDEINGLFALKIDINSNEIIAEKISPFNQELVAKSKDEKTNRIKNGEGISCWYQANQYLPNEDGTTWVLMEKKHSTSDKYGTVYYFDSILAILLNEKCEIVNYTFIPKRQVMGFLNMGVGSFYAMIKNNNLYLIMNDHIENLLAKSENEKDYKILANGKNSNLTIVHLAKDGTFNKQQIFNNDKKICHINKCFQLTDNSLGIEVVDIYKILETSGICQFEIE